MGSELIILLATSVISAIIGGFGKAIIDSRKQKSDATLSANDQAFLVMKSLLDLLQKQVENLTIDQTKLELEFLAARENNVELRIKNQFLSKENEKLIEKVKELEASIRA